MSKIYSTRHVGVLIGRFQPFHLGHAAIIKNAYVAGLKFIKIFVGSANCGRSIKNPFTFKERSEMISLGISELCEQLKCGTISCHPGNDKYPPSVICTNKKEQILSVEIYPSNDYIYNDDRWKMEIMEQLDTFKQPSFIPKYVLLGYKKDESSWYLDQFPEFDSTLIDNPISSVPVCTGGNFSRVINATEIRDQYFSEYKYDLNQWAHWLSPKVIVFLEIFRESYEQYSYLQKEFKYIHNYKSSWQLAPYHPMFVTTDALVQQGNYVLLIQRKSPPGKNLWAMPGGFVNQNELLKDGMIRELREETGLKVPEPVLRGSITEIEVFDHLDRSSRGRTITHVYHIRLNPETLDLPTIKGGSDAKRAKWFTLQEIVKMKQDMFEDHWDIISKLIGF